MASEPTLSSLAALAASASAVEDENYNLDPSSSRGAPKTKEQLRRHYIRSLHKVIDESDIIILVLDARDPEGCRSRLVEEEVRRRESEGKRLVFVLNKVGESPIFPPVCLTPAQMRSFNCHNRPYPSRECTSLASASSPHDPYPPVQVRRLSPTLQSVVLNGACSPPSAQGIQAHSTEHHRRHRGVPQRRQE